jgi:putative membrane protein
MNENSKPNRFIPHPSSFIILKGGTMRYLLIRWAILVVAIWLTAWLMSGFNVEGGLEGLLVVAAVLGLINAFIRPLLIFLTCPLVLLTLGLFTLVINALLLSLTAWLLPSLVSLEGFWTTFFASLIISIISAALGMFVHEDRSK